MEEMHTISIPTWRDLLQQRISNSREKQRLAKVLGVTPLTLVRWANGSATPRSESLKHLATALPEIAKELRESMSQGATLRSYEQLSANERNASIAVAFYREILDLRAKTPRSIRFWSLCNRILAHMVATLDSPAADLVVVIATCTPPREDELPIRSLHSTLSRSTSSTFEDPHTIPVYLLGAESLVVYAALRGQLISSQNREEYDYYGTNLGTQGSTVSCPIESGNRVAGCLNVSTSVPDFFQPADLDLIVTYSRLLALAFDDEMFYEPEHISLAIMPSQEVQRIAFASFRKRVMQLMRETRGQKQPLTMTEAETFIWQQLEEEMIQQVLRTHHNNES